MKHICPHCGKEFEGYITEDYLGWQTSCPECQGSFDVRVSPAADILEAVLIGFLVENKSEMKAHDTIDLEESSAWKQAREMFISIAMLRKLEPDTCSGDGFLSDIYEQADLESTVCITDLDYFMWENLT